MPEIVDDKSQHCISFVIERLHSHTQRHCKADSTANTPPFFLGLNGVQGAGKTVLVRPKTRPASTDPPPYLRTAGRPQFILG